MEIDRNIGYWNAENTSILDDMAYMLLVKQMEKDIMDHVSQVYFLNYKNDFPYSRYYKEANLLIRQDKITSINSKIEDKKRVQLNEYHRIQTENS